MRTGKVKWFDARRGFGFIIQDDGLDVFVHFTVIEGEGFRALKDGESVQYEASAGPKGLLATRVTRTAATPPVTSHATPPVTPAAEVDTAPIVAPTPTQPPQPAPKANHTPVPVASPEEVEDPLDSIGNRRQPGDPPTNPDAALRKIIEANIPVKIRPSKPQ